MNNEKDKMTNNGRSAASSSENSTQRNLEQVGFKRQRVEWNGEHGERSPSTIFHLVPSRIPKPNHSSSQRFRTVTFRVWFQVSCFERRHHCLLPPLRVRAPAVLAKQWKEDVNDTWKRQIGKLWRRNSEGLQEQVLVKRKTWIPFQIVMCLGTKIEAWRTCRSRVQKMSNILCTHAVENVSEKTGKKTRSLES